MNISKISLYYQVTPFSGGISSSDTPNGLNPFLKWAYGGNVSSPPSMDQFRTEFRLVWEGAVQDVSETAHILEPESLLESLFSLFNGEDNPLYTDKHIASCEEMKKLGFIPHTSMSVGDIVEFVTTDDDGKSSSKYYMTSGLGFVLIPWD